MTGYIATVIMTLFPLSPLPDYLKGSSTKKEQGKYLLEPLDAARGQVKPGGKQGAGVGISSPFKYSWAATCTFVQLTLAELNRQDTFNH